MSKLFLIFYTIVLIINVLLVQSINIDPSQTHRQLLAYSATQTFSYTGNVQSFTVPSDLYSLTIDAYGSQGANYDSLGTGGLGGYIQASISATPGQTLNVYVGGQSGFNGGGTGGIGNSYGNGIRGGDATDIRTVSGSLTSRLVVTGGGGGGGYADCTIIGVSESSGGKGGSSVGC